MVSKVIFKPCLHFCGIAAFFLLSACSNDPIIVAFGEESYDSISSDSISSSSEFSSSSIEDAKSSSSVAKTISISKDDDSDDSSSSEESAGSGFPPCKTKTEDNCEYGLLVDDRDGHVYKTVVIGDQTWMAENLNYRYILHPDDAEECDEEDEEECDEVEYGDSSSFCYNNELANCVKYGRLYIWSAAMDSAGIIPGNTATLCGYGYLCYATGKVRGVCPEGWHLPDTTEWQTLFTTVGVEKAATMLKSTEGWYGKNNGMDNFGFSALPAGILYHSSYYFYDQSADFWTTASYGTSMAYYIQLGENSDYGYDGYLGRSSKFYEAHSVRCIKD